MGINYHEEWQNIRQGDQLTKTTLQTDRRVIAELNRNNFVEKNGVLFIVSKKEQSIPLDSTMEVTLLLV